MRKLMFATALVASVAAFAAPITAINFEGYTVGSTVGNFETDTPDVVGGDTIPRFVYDGTADDSTVKAYGADTLAPPTIRAAAFTNETETSNGKYLELRTGDGTLWRSINEAKPTTVDDQTTWNLGAAQPVGEGIYLDTLVQFTAWEDDAPTVGEADKLAIWLSATTNSDGVAEMNLMVTAAVVDDQGGRTPTNFIMNTAATIEADKWYRLTVKAVSDITDGDGIEGFQIFLDGDMVTSSTPTLTKDYLDLIDSHSTYADIVAGKYFASLVSEDDTMSLQAVGFQGTGAVDDIVWTNEDLFPDVAPSTVELTLTGGDNATVAYVIGGETNTIGTISESWTTNIAANTEVVIMATPNTGYTYATATELEGWTLSGTEITYTLANIAANTSVAVPNAVELSAWYDSVEKVFNGVELTAAQKTAIKEWARANSITVADGKEEIAAAAYLLNLDTLPDAVPELKITSIEETEVGDGESKSTVWRITVAATVTANETETTLPLPKTINGVVTLTQATELAALKSATPSKNGFTATVDSTVTVVDVPKTNDASKFMKVGVSIKAAAE